MEVLPRAVAGSSVLATASASAAASSSSAEKRRKSVQVGVPSGIPFLHPASSLVASLLASAPPAVAAVNYDEFVKKASESASSAADAAGSSFPELPSVDLPAVDFGGATDFLSANPLALVAGLAAVVVPFVASRALAGPTSSGPVSAAEAYENLADPERSAQLLDIRAAEDVKAEGSPNLKAIRKAPIRVAYAADDDKFVDKVLARTKAAEDATIYVLGSKDGNAAIVAKLLANSGFKSAYAVKGGSDGWLDQELPWTTPSKSFNFNVDGLKSIIPDGDGADPGSLSTTLGIAAVAGVGIIAFSEVETTLQVLGAVALLQLFVKKFLFAEDRKKTVEDIRTLLDSKIAPKGFVDEIKDVGRALLPKEGEIKAAIGTGAAVLEKELNVDSVTPETLAEKAKEKLVEEADKAGVEIPDFEGVTADLKSGAQELAAKAQEAAADLKSGAQELQPKAQEVAADLKSGAQEIAASVEESVTDLKSGAQDLPAKAEEAAADLKSGAQDFPAKAEEAVADLKSGAQDLPAKAEEAVADLKSGAQDLPAKAEEAAADLKSGVQELPAKAEETVADLKSGAQDLQPKAEEAAADLESKSGELASDVESGAEAVGADLKTSAEEATKPSNGAAAPEPAAAKKVVPFFADERDSSPAAPEGDAPTAGGDIAAEKVVPFFEDERDSALAAFEGDEPAAVEQVGEDISATKLEGVTADKSS